MASLPTTLSPTIENTSRTYKPRVLINDFGDGYSQRVADGINTINRTITVSYTGTATQISVYNDFFTNLSGASSFDWAPPNESTSLKWICKEWSIRDLGPSVQQLDATFTQVFDLG